MPLPVVKMRGSHLRVPSIFTKIGRSGYGDAVLAKTGVEKTKKKRGRGAGGGGRNNGKRAPLHAAEGNS